MRLVNALSILSIVFILGCDEKPDAWDCTFIYKAEAPLDSYSFCVNMKTKVEKSVPLDQMHKYTTTDPESRERIRKHYLDQCVYDPDKSPE